MCFRSLNKTCVRFVAKILAGVPKESYMTCWGIDFVGEQAQTAPLLNK